MSSSIDDLAARKSDCLETSWEASLCHRLHLDPSYAREILHRKKVHPRLIDFGWTAIHVVDRRATDSDGLETSREASLCHRLHFDPSHAREILPRKKVDPWVIDFGWTAIHVVDHRATDSDGLETSWEASLCHRLHFDPSHARFILTRHMHVGFGRDHDALIYALQPTVRDVVTDRTGPYLGRRHFLRVKKQLS
ncbi:uncharacterized protein G2W53_044866 [Senna tora]|uniref:Uncharacterized protein n=1 Tax=Senna tora TaxID=362788 RepID=A0A834VXX4_9FABA|nr:uncharacterized protein G2W53_044866 [Senna tora]